MRAVRDHPPRAAGGASRCRSARIHRSARARSGSRSRRQGSTSPTRWRGSASIRTPRRPRASSATRSAGEVESVGEGVESHKVGDRVIAATRFNGQAELVTVPRGAGAAAAQEALVRAGGGVPGQLRDRLRGADHHGRAEGGRPGPDPRRRRWRGDLGDPDRQGRRRRDLRHRLGLQARGDPRAGGLRTRSTTAPRTSSRRSGGSRTARAST